jgi:replicative DNA helicase
MTTKAEIESFLSVQHRKFLREIKRAKDANQSHVLTADDVLEQKLLEDKYDENPITTGIDFWDELIGPFRRGNVYVVAGYAGVGKTTLAMQLAWAVTQQNRKVWFYCLELKPTEVMEVLASHIEGNSPPTKEEYLVANTKVHRSGFRFFDSREYRTWEQHLEIIESSVNEHGFELLVIDNFHYLTRTSKNTFEIEGVVSQRLKSLSQSCNIPILLLHHLRKPESDSLEPEPTVHAMRGASAVLNDSSAVVLLHHPLAETDGSEQAARLAVGKLRCDKARWGTGGTKYVRLIGHRRLYEATHSSNYRHRKIRERKHG